MVDLSKQIQTFIIVCLKVRNFPNEGKDLGKKPKKKELDWETDIISFSVFELGLSLEQCYEMTWREYHLKRGGLGRIKRLGKSKQYDQAVH